MRISIKIGRALLSGNLFSDFLEERENCPHRVPGYVYCH